MKVDVEVKLEGVVVEVVVVAGTLCGDTLAIGGVSQGE